MRDIVGFNPRSAVGTYAGAAISGARATDTAGFTRRVMQWSDLPAQSRALDDGLGDMLDEGVKQMTGHARKINGRPHQVCLAWRAYLDRIIVVRAVRALIQRPDGRMAPDGPWSHDQGTVYAVTAAKRTTGLVPSVVREDAPNPDDSTTDALPAEQRRAASAQTFLPVPVQATITRAVPDPEVWLDAYWQMTQNGAATEQHLAILRIGGGKAALAVAARSAGHHVEPGKEADEHFKTLPWRVTQVTYTLRADTALNAAAVRAQVGGAR